MADDCNQGLQLFLGGAGEFVDDQQPFAAIKLLQQADPPALFGDPAEFGAKDAVDRADNVIQTKGLGARRAARRNPSSLQLRRQGRAERERGLGDRFR